MKPQAYEALQKAKALFRHPAEVLQDEIPEEVKSVFPDGIRKPRVVLLPPNAPKFDKESMKQESKAQAIISLAQENGITPPKLIDKYVGMSTLQATDHCVSKGIIKPAHIAKETGKNINQIYTALWKLKNTKVKKVKAKATPKPKQKQACVNTDFDHEPTAWEDAHMVVTKSRADYEKEIERLNLRITDLLIEKQEQATIIRYFERKLHV
jgi:hypothetical protein